MPASTPPTMPGNTLPRSDASASGCPPGAVPAPLPAGPPPPDFTGIFLRPISWYGLWLGREAGRATAAIMLRLFPTLFVGWLLFDIALPSTASQGLRFLIAVALAVWVSFSIRLLLNLTSFWLIDHRGVAATSMSIGTFLSGMAMPIDFFPGPLRTVAELLPFQAVMMAPNIVYLGKGSALEVYGVQAMWVGILGVACLALLRQGERKLVVHGG